MSEDTPSPVRFEGDSFRRAPYLPLFGPPSDPACAGPLGRAPFLDIRAAFWYGALGRETCDGCGDRIPRTYSRRARAANRRPPHRAPGHSGRCSFRGCQGLPLLQRSPTDERERTRTGTAPAGPGVGTQAPARTSRPTQPGRDCRSGRGTPAVSSARSRACATVTRKRPPARCRLRVRAARGATACIRSTPR